MAEAIATRLRKTLTYKENLELSLRSVNKLEFRKSADISENGEEWKVKVA